VSSSRPNTVYQIEIPKDVVDNIGRGKLPNGSFAPQRIFKPWSSDSFMSRLLTITTASQKHPQSLIPTAVIETENFYTVQGYLRSNFGPLSDEGELEIFKAQNRYLSKELSPSSLMH